MKHAKKYWIFIFALLLLLGMAGCGETVAGPTGSTDSMQASGTVDNPGNTDGPDNTKDPDHTDEPGKTEELGNTGELEGTILVKSDQNWEKAFSRGEGVFSDQGFYYLDAHILTFLDTEAGVSTPLCTRAGCLHGDAPGHGYEECDGYGNVRTYGDMVTYWDGYLYYVRTEASGAYRLYRCNAIGTEHTEVCQLGKRYTDDEKTLMPAITQAAADGKWYYHTRVSGLVRDPETGAGRFQQILEYIAVVDLTTGKETVLLEDKNDLLLILAASSNGVLYTAQENVSGELWGNRRIALKFWNKETGKIGTLLEKTGDDLYWGCDGKVRGTTYMGDVDYTFDLATGEEKQLTGVQVYHNWLNGYANYQDPDTMQWYLVHLQTEEKLPSEVPLDKMIVQQTGEHGAVLLWIVEAAASGNSREQRMCYVTYEALEDGLQESDLLCYLTR